MFCTGTGLVDNKRNGGVFPLFDPDINIEHRNRKLDRSGRTSSRFRETDSVQRAGSTNHFNDRNCGV